MPSPHLLHPSSLPGPSSHFIHVIHHSVHHKRKDSKDAKKKPKPRSNSVEREDYSPHPSSRNLSHSHSTSQINLSLPRPIPFPKSPSHSSAFSQHQKPPSQPNTPAQVHYSDLLPVPFEHKRSRSTSNVLQKRRPSISLSNTQQVFHPQSAPYSPSPLQLSAPQKPLHGILKNKNSAQQLQPIHATFQYSKCTGRKRAVCVCCFSYIELF